MKPLREELGSEKGSLIVSIHFTEPQIELYTTRGQSYLVRGNDAVQFAEWLKMNIVEPILGEWGGSYGQPATADTTTETS